MSSMCDREDLFGCAPSAMTAWFDAIPFAVIVHSLETVVCANAAAHRRLKADSGWLVGRPLSELVHPEGRDAGRQRRSILFRDGHLFSAVPLKLITAQGDTVHTHAHARRVDVGGEPFVVVMEAPAEQTSAWEASLGAGALSFPAGTSCVEAALRALPAAIMVTDMERVRMVSQAGALLLGATPRDLEGHALSSLLHPDMGPGNDRRRIVLSSQATVRDLEAKLVRRDGNPLYVRVDGHPAGGDDDRVAIWWAKRVTESLIDQAG